MAVPEAAGPPLQSINPPSYPPCQCSLLASAGQSPAPPWSNATSSHPQILAVGGGAFKVTVVSLKWRGEGEVPTLRIRPCRGPFPRAQQRCRIIREAATGEYSLLPGLEAPQDGWLKSRRQQNHNDCNIALQVRAGPSPSPVLPKSPVLAAQVTKHAVVTWDCTPRARKARCTAMQLAMAPLAKKGRILTFGVRSCQDGAGRAKRAPAELESRTGPGGRLPSSPRLCSKPVRAGGTAPDARMRRRVGSYPSPVKR